MKFPLHLLRIATLSIAGMALIIVASAIRPVYANPSQPESEAERYALAQLQKGEWADLGGKFPSDSFPRNMRELRGSFIASLLADGKIHRNGMGIQGAVITGDFELMGQEIPYDVSMVDCIFEGHVDPYGSRFAKSLTFTNSTFEKGVDFSGVTVGYEFSLMRCVFPAYRADFRDMRIEHFRIDRCTFRTDITLFQGVSVGGVFFVADSEFASMIVSFAGAKVGADFIIRSGRFRSQNVYFDGMRVDGSFSAKGSEFSFKASETATLSRVSFGGASLADLILNGSSFDGISTIDFTGLQADFISFDDVTLKTPSDLKLKQLTFKRLTPVDPKRVQFLLDQYDAEFYTSLEASWRTHGYLDEADKIFIAKRRAERRLKCEDFLRKCDRVAWASSMFQDALAGYGKRLQNLLYWSLGFLLLGTVTFRREKGMRTKDAKEAEHYEGKYNPFWYSLDLFLPIIKLGEADVWTPKDDRRWANLYRKLHIIIGSLFVPIGLAAWTGIIK